MRRFICAVVFAVLLCGNAWAYVIINAENFPDEAFRSYVQTEIANDNGILLDDEIEGVDYIGVNSLGISSLKGIEFFTNLEILECEGNSLAELNVPASLTEDSSFGTQIIDNQVLSVDNSYPYQFDLNKLITSSDNLSRISNLRALDSSSNNIRVNNLLGGGVYNLHLNQQA